MSLSRLRRHLAAVPALLFVVVAVSGCISESVEKPTRFAGLAVGGTAYQGWDYEGATGMPLNGSIEFDVDDVTNTGAITADGSWMAQNVTIRMTAFNHSADDFHDGGVAMHLFEHGDSGNGDTLLPKMFILLATWGPATIESGDGKILDPYTGNESWAAHVMVTDTGIRDEADGGKVKSAAGIYTPDAPGDAVVTDDLEAILILQSRAPEGDIAPVNVTLSGTVGQPGALVDTETVPVAAIGSAIGVTVDFGNEPQEVGPYQVRLLDPTGKALVTRPLKGAQPSNTAVTFSFVGETIGNHTVEVRSTVGAPGSFTGTVDVIAPPRPLHWFHWENVRIDAGGR